MLPAPPSKASAEASLEVQRLQNATNNRKNPGLVVDVDDLRANRQVELLAAKSLTAALEKQKIVREGLAKAESATVQARIPLLDIRAAALSDESTAATTRHETALGKLRDAYAKNRDSVAYQNGVVEINNKLESDQAAIKEKSKEASKAASAAKREEAKATRELIAAQKELEAALNSVLSKFDPARSITKDFRENLETIDKLRFAGLIDASQALEYRLGAAREQAERLAELAVKDLKSTLGYTIGGSDDPLKAKGFDQDSIMAGLDQKSELEYEAAERTSERIKSLEQSRIQDLASLYETAFTQGTKGLWSTFKQIGIQVIAETLARFTIANVVGGGGGFECLTDA